MMAKCLKNWSRWADSNRRPTDYESHGQSPGKHMIYFSFSAFRHNYFLPSNTVEQAQQRREEK